MRPFELESMNTGLQGLIYPLIEQKEILKHFLSDNSLFKTKNPVTRSLHRDTNNSYISNVVELFVGWEKPEDGAYSLKKLINEILTHYVDVNWGEVPEIDWEATNAKYPNPWGQGILPTVTKQKSLKPSVQELIDIRDKLNKIEECNKELFEQIRIYRNNYAVHIGSPEERAKLIGFKWTDTFPIADQLVDIFFEINLLLTGSHYGLNSYKNQINTYMGSLSKNSFLKTDIRNLYFEDLKKNSQITIEGALKIYARLLDDLEQSKVSKIHRKEVMKLINEIPIESPS